MERGAEFRRGVVLKSPTPFVFQRLPGRGGSGTDGVRSLKKPQEITPTYYPKLKGQALKPILFSII